MVKQIKIRIFPDGKIESETVGIKGKTCLNYIKEIENLTGANVTKSKFTNEYNETDESFYSSMQEYQHNGN